MNKNMLPRVCRECRNTFPGGPRAWYCPACRAERARMHDKINKARRRAGDVLPLGSFIKCEVCGAEIVKNGGRQRYCESCAAAHLKEVDNRQSLEWKAKNPEKIKESKRALSKKRHEEDGKESGIKYITWDKGCKKWRVRPYINGEQINAGRFDDLDEAIKALEEVLEKNKA